MLNATKFRVSLALVTLAGAFHLNSAKAAEPAQADCQSYANGYAAGYCAATGTTPASITFTCYPNGSVTVHKVTCHEPY
jgi:hypothetical protein